MEQVSPTRTELLTRRAQINLAEQGAEMLRSKREVLVREFLKELKNFSLKREQIRSAVVEAVQSLLTAIAIDGTETLSSVASVTRQPVTVELKKQNIWGASVINVISDYSVRSSESRGYTPYTVSARIDETAERFEQVVEHAIHVAPIEHKLSVLAEHIRKTSRRVNALEQRLIPSLREQINFIRNTLDQREREDTFRLKRLKQKKTRAEPNDRSSTI
ncbi:MAG: V-type ATP synthase subunit D [Planctomycetes bacterium]|nr:V-type ATP synthase subunit D [Planctomycetota bacterium]